MRMCGIALVASLAPRRSGSRRAQVRQISGRSHQRSDGAGSARGHGRGRWEPDRGAGQQRGPNYVLNAPGGRRRTSWSGPSATSGSRSRVPADAGDGGRRARARRRSSSRRSSSPVRPPAWSGRICPTPSRPSRSSELTRAPTPDPRERAAGQDSGRLHPGELRCARRRHQLNLRGVSTINGSVDPLYVVDGIVVSNAAIPNGPNAVSCAQCGGNPRNQDNPVNRIADLNPEDIERIEVLKGGSAAAIYGSKATNGVVIITTKRGQVGKPQFNISQKFGISSRANELGSPDLRHSGRGAVGLQRHRRGDRRIPAGHGPSTSRTSCTAARPCPTRPTPA